MTTKNSKKDETPTAQGVNVQPVVSAQKVFCKNCRYEDLPFHQCNKLIKKAVFNQFSTIKVESSIYAQPLKQNRTGDCSYYEPKKWYQKIFAH